MRIFTIVLIIILSSQFAISQSDATFIQGKVTSNNTNEALFDVDIAIYKHSTDTIIATTKTDLEGNYAFSNLETGFYDMTLDYTCHHSIKVVGVKIKEGRIERNIKLYRAMCPTVVHVSPFKVPLIDWSNTRSGSIFISEDLRNSPIKN